MRSRKRLLIVALAVTAVAAVSTATITHANADTRPTPGPQPASATAGPTGGLQLAPAEGTGGTADITSLCWVFENVAPWQDRDQVMMYGRASVACEQGVAAYYGLRSYMLLRLSDTKSEIQSEQTFEVDRVGAQYAAAAMSAPCLPGMWWSKTDVYITLVDGTSVKGTITSAETPIYNC